MCCTASSSITSIPGRKKIDRLLERDGQELHINSQAGICQDCIAKVYLLLLMITENDVSVLTKSITSAILKLSTI